MIHRAYQNIFWHQGVKIFEEGFENKERGRHRIEHLENDVTKSLLNLFEHCSPAVFKAFLSMLGVRDAPESFELDFQVMDTTRYRKCPIRIMLSLISESTQTVSSPAYSVAQSRPDACIANNHTAILIEAKTQSNLVTEQLEHHIRHYLGAATSMRTLTWEQLSETFTSLKGLNAVDSFLVRQFIDFLELIGLGEFRGFSESDFAIIGSIQKVSSTEYLDISRLHRRKLLRFMELLCEQIKDSYSFKPFQIRIGNANAQYPGNWAAFSFHDCDTGLAPNYYPNLNFNTSENGIELTINAEVQQALKRFIRLFRSNPSRVEQEFSKLGEFRLSLYFKLQYLPMDHFIVRLIPGYPKALNDISCSDVLQDMKTFEESWPREHHTLLFQMETGSVRHKSGRMFTEKELHHAHARNPKSNFMIRIEKRYSASEIGVLKASIVTFFRDELLKLRDLVMLVNG